MAVSYTHLDVYKRQEWEFEIRMDFKPSDQNHIRLHVYLDDQRMLGLKNDYYVQIGSNKKTITFRKHTATEKNPKILIEKALDVLLGAVDLKVKLTLENHKTVSYTHLDVYKRQVY